MIRREGVARNFVIAKNVDIEEDCVKSSLHPFLFNTGNINLFMKEVWSAVTRVF